MGEYSTSELESQLSGSLPKEYATWLNEKNDDVDVKWNAVATDNSDNLDDGMIRLYINPDLVLVRNIFVRVAPGSAATGLTWSYDTPPKHNIFTSGELRHDQRRLLHRLRCLKKKIAAEGRIAEDAQDHP